MVNAHDEKPKDEESAERLWEVVTRATPVSGNTQESLEQLLNPSADDIQFVGGHKIKKFDVIKLGRFKFRVKDLACENMGLTEQELFEQELKEARQVITLGE